MTGVGVAFQPRDKIEKLYWQMISTLDSYWSRTYCDQPILSHELKLKHNICFN